METIGTWWMWAGFFAFVIAILALDLFVLGGRKAHRMSVREAAGWSAVWVGIALLFALLLWWYLRGEAGADVAQQKSLEFLTGYVAEKSLAVDNVFIWLMLFSYFAIPIEYQRRVLLYGVVSAIFMRTVMILIGAWLIAQFHWILYVFGAFLAITGIKMFWFSDHEPDLEKNPALKWMRRHMRVTQGLRDEKFFVWKDGLRYATPLFLALVLVEIADLIFAVDSIPAIFAILGLCAMCFLLAGFAHRFSLLKYGLAIVLMFIGVKMLLLDIYKIPVGWPLLVVAVIIGASVILSLRRERGASVASGSAQA